MCVQVVYMSNTADFKVTESAILMYCLSLDLCVGIAVL